MPCPWASIVSTRTSPDQRCQVTNICEIVRLESVSIRLCIRRRPRSGKNFDIVTGHDVADPDVKLEILRYIRKHKPLFVIMGPPCAAFACWPRQNRQLYLETWRRSRAIGDTLATFAATIAREQLSGRRNFSIENFRGSEFSQLNPYRELWETGQVVEVAFPQCALLSGLAPC